MTRRHNQTDFGEDILGLAAGAGAAIERKWLHRRISDAEKTKE